MLQVKETYVNETEGYQFGNSDWTEPYTGDDRGALFRAMQSEFGRCTGRMYITTSEEEAKPIGWVFQKVMLYEGARPDHYSRAGNPIYAENEYYLRTVWVELRERNKRECSDECALDRITRALKAGAAGLITSDEIQDEISESVASTGRIL